MFSPRQPQEQRGGISAVGMVSTAWMISSAVVTLSAVIQAVTGFGFALTAVPFLLLVQPPTTVICTTLTISMLSLVFLSAHVRRDVEPELIKWLLVGGLMGLPMGLYALRFLDAGLLKLLASVASGFAGGYCLARPPYAPASSAYHSRWPTGCIISGVIAGFLTTSVSMPGPPVVFLLNRLGLNKHQFRATCVMFLLSMYPISLVMLAVSGLLTFRVLLSALALSPFALIGNRIGITVFQRVPGRIFNILVSVVLVLNATYNAARLAGL